MAGKMLEPDGNTQDVQLSSLTPGSIHNDDNYSNSFENGDGYLNSCNTLPNNTIMREKLSLPLDNDGNCSKSDSMYDTSKTGGCSSSLLQENSRLIGHQREDDSPLKLSGNHSISYNKLSCTCNFLSVNKMLYWLLNFILRQQNFTISMYSSILFHVLMF